MAEEGVHNGQPQQRGAEAAAPAAETAGAHGREAASPARPANVPEKFWDPEKGTIRTEALLKAYSDTERALRGKRDELRSEVLREIYAGRPEKPEGYEIRAPDGADDLVILHEVPEGFKPEPGKVYFHVSPESEAFREARAMAWEYGVPPERFARVVAAVAREMGVRVPTPEERAARDQEIYRQLGEHGQRRVQHLWGQLKTKLGPRADALDEVVSSPAAIEALEALVEAAGGARFSPPAAGAAKGPLTEAELREMMRDPRYADPTKRDPKFVEQVTQGWRTLYPG